MGEAFRCGGSKTYEAMLEGTQQAGVQRFRRVRKKGQESEQRQWVKREGGRGRGERRGGRNSGLWVQSNLFQIKNVDVRVLKTFGEKNRQFNIFDREVRCLGCKIVSNFRDPAKSKITKTKKSDIFLVRVMRCCFLVLGQIWEKFRIREKKYLIIWSPIDRRRKRIKHNVRTRWWCGICNVVCRYIPINSDEKNPIHMTYNKTLRVMRTLKIAGTLEREGGKTSAAIPELNSVKNFQ